VLLFRRSNAGRGFLKSNRIIIFVNRSPEPRTVGLVVMIAAFHLTDQRQSRVQFPDSSTFALKQLISIVFVSGMGFRLNFEVRVRCAARKEHSGVAGSNYPFSLP
jgi:hypothetical protein